MSFFDLSQEAIDYEIYCFIVLYLSIFCYKIALLKGFILLVQIYFIEFFIKELLL